MKAARLLVVMGVLCASSACSEIRESRFKSHEEARLAGLADRGWLAGCLTANARDIEEAHNLDTNEQWIAFTADLQPQAAWKSLDRAAVSQLRVRSPRGISWWPSELGSAAAISASGRIVFAAHETDRSCFVAQGASRNYCWCDSR